MRPEALPIPKPLHGEARPRIIAWRRGASFLVTRLEMAKAITSGAQALDDLGRQGLLRTKLYIPPSRGNRVARPRLTARLNEGLARKLTLISAPPGFGKTTALGEWIPQSDACVTWVSLDEGDNDPVRFWSYVIGALHLLRPGLGEPAVSLLHAPQSVPLPVVLTALVNAIDAFPDPFALVLDDYHVIDAAPVHAGMNFLLDHLPPRMHLYVTSRSDPPFPLARLRARDQLVEIRASDLRFTLEEAAAFLEPMLGFRLSESDLRVLEARTEGWAAGLQFAALSLRDRTDPSAFLAAFGGSHRFVLDYFTEQALAQQPEALVSFMLDTCILDRFTASLCAAVAERPEARALLDQLERHNLFLTALDQDRQWYRYHPLFAQVLQSQLLATNPSRVPGLHARASGWYEQHDLIPEAIEHAFRGNDYGRGTSLLYPAVERAILRGEFTTAEHWLGRVPESEMAARPILCIEHAVALMFTNRLEAAEKRLQDAERWVKPETSPEHRRLVLGAVAANRSSLVRLYGDTAGCVRLAQEALALLPEGESAAFTRAACQVNAAHAFLVTGDATTAEEQRVAAVVEPARSAGHRVALARAQVLLARLRTLQGKLHRAEATFAQVVQAVEGDFSSLLGGPAYYFGMGDLYCEWNDLGRAEGYLSQGMELAEGAITVHADFLAMGYLAQARVQQARGDRAAALKTLERFIQLAHERQYVEPYAAQAEAAQALVYLRNGQGAEALRWAETAGREPEMPPTWPHESQDLTLARVWTATGKTERALDRLDRMRQAAESLGRMGSVLQIRVISALAYHAQGDLTQALDALAPAVALAAPEGYLRVFLDEDEPMRALLQALVREAAARGFAADHVRTLLAHFPAPAVARPAAGAPPAQPGSNSGMLEPLSEREGEVLRLVAAGASNREIADRLVISIATVKRHITNIHGKLQVTSRTQAIARAREHGLL